MEIGTLTSVLLGYSDPYLLYQYGKIQGDVDQLTLLQKLISPSRDQYCLTFFNK
jgi:predicted acetyltransferase